MIIQLTSLNIHKHNAYYTMVEEQYIVVHNQKILVNAQGYWSHSSIVDFESALLAPNEILPVHSNANSVYRVIEVGGEWQEQKLWSYRQLMATLADDECGVISRALQLLTWRKQHRYCGHCGTPTQSHQSEQALFCPNCHSIYYPRISPCMMCLILRDEECLLAHHQRHPQGMYSTLAGFVEAGESLEQTLHREVLEEVGLKVKNLRYFASQSWPFPHQLMAGFFADYDSGDICVDGDEIVDAQWFHYSQLPTIPERTTLSGQLIAEFIRRYSSE